MKLIERMTADPGFEIRVNLPHPLDLRGNLQSIPTPQKYTKAHHLILL
jgi:hypothetical protein